MPSPILQRTHAQPLTLELLSEKVPHVKAGYEALERIKNKEYTDRHEYRNLTALKSAGSAAQEILIISALPLIKNIASKEFQRRRAWNSRVSYDDILQEAIAGFIRGLLSYNETSKHVSPTNYLGQWITTTIRRKIEVMDHDFAIPYEVIERARRIKAVHSRLVSELTREPTDEELLNALNSPEPYLSGYKWGKIKVETDTPKTAAANSRQKSITQKQLNETRELAARSYAMQSNDAAFDEDSESYERLSTPLTVDEPDQRTDLDSKDLSRSRVTFFEEVFLDMRMGSRQKDIILRYFGLNPYSESQIQKDIVSETGLPLKFVKEVIMAFSQYMPVKGGIFHQKVLTTTPDMIESLELGWLVPLVGEWPKEVKEPITAPAVLTQAGTKVR